MTLIHITCSSCKLHTYETQVLTYLLLYVIALSTFFFLSFLTIVTITHTITITRTPLTTPTNIPPIHGILLVFVSLLPVGHSICIVLIVEDGDMVTEVTVVMIVIVVAVILMTLVVNTSVTVTKEQI